MPIARRLPATMRYIAAREPGPPDVLALAEGPLPQPKAGEVLIEVASRRRQPARLPAARRRVSAAARRVADHRSRSRRDASSRCGEGVTAWHVGDAVCALTPGGGYAEYCTTPAGFCLPIPARPDAARGGEPARELLHRLEQRLRPRPPARGETVLIHGGTSGIGLTAIQLAKQFGATVITTAGSDDKAAFCRVDRRRSRDQLPDAGFRRRGRAHHRQARRRRRPRHGRRRLRREEPEVPGARRPARQIAFLHGSRVEIDWRHIMLKRLTVTGSTLRASPAERKVALARRAAREVWPLFESGE